MREEDLETPSGAFLGAHDGGVLGVARLEKIRTPPGRSSGRTGCAEDTYRS